MKKYQMLPHTADLRIMIYGETLENLFCHALQGMFESMEPMWKKAKGVRRKIKVSSADLNALLVDFLSEALSLCDIHNEAYTNVKIDKITNEAISGTLIGKPIKRFALEIKAVTHHGLDIKRVGDRWETEVMFDI